jgi:hypothetical protein
MLHGSLPRGQHGRTIELDRPSSAALTSCAVQPRCSIIVGLDYLSVVIDLHLVHPHRFSIDSACRCARVLDAAPVP